MRIAISVFRGNTIEYDGDSVRAIRIINVLKKKHDITLIAPVRKNQQINNIPIITVGGSAFWNLRLIPILVRNRFDCIYCSHDWRGFITYYLFSKIYKHKIIFDAHSIISEDTKEIQGSNLLKYKLVQILEKFNLKRADHVIAASKNTFDFYKMYNKRINLINVFVDEEMFKNRMHDQMSVKGGLKQIGLIGPFNNPANKYSLDFLYKNLSKFDSKIKFIVIGKCSNINRVKNERVTYTGYIESIQDYAKQLCELDAVLVPMKIATTGPCNKILEPMSCSLPVFTTPKGLQGLYYAKPGENILVFEDDELLKKVNKLIFDEELMKRMGDNARITVEKYYSKKANENKIIDIVEKVGRRLSEL